MKEENYYCGIGGLEGGRYKVTFDKFGASIKVYDEHISVEYADDDKIYTEYDLLATADTIDESTSFFEVIGLLDEVVPEKNESYYMLRDVVVQHRMILSMQYTKVFNSKYLAYNPYFTEIRLCRTHRGRKNRWYPEITPEQAERLEKIHNLLTHKIE